MRNNVIAAVSTPPGKGGVAIIRMCGVGAVELAEEVFRPASGRKITSYPPRTQIYGYIEEKGERIDDGMLTYFTAPSSYTGEDTVEISCHGGVLVTECVLETLFIHGAIPAERGEFTRRAFVNGKLTLTDAEAIGNLLDAKSASQVRLFSGEQREKLRCEIDGIRESLTDVLSSIYARIDYPDEDLGDYTDAECAARLEKIAERLSTLIATYRTGRAINEGISAVICGKPNVGKSTLYNMLLGEDAAIVTDIAGTTRDCLEKTVPLGRVLLHLADTAGIRGGDIDRVEKIGIDRARERILGAELIFALFDLSRAPDGEDLDTIDELRHAHGVKICILTKEDEGAYLSEFEKILPPELFAKTLTLSVEKDSTGAKAAITDAVNSLFTDEKISVRDDAIVASARQHGALVRALDFIRCAIDAYREGVPTDAASSDIEMGLSAISEVDGRAVADSVTNDIFAKFCVGK